MEDTDATLLLMLTIIIVAHVLSAAWHYAPLVADAVSEATLSATEHYRGCGSWRHAVMVWHLRFHASVTMVLATDDDDEDDLSLT
jgi:hypothetical protein